MKTISYTGTLLSLTIACGQTASNEPTPQPGVTVDVTTTASSPTSAALSVTSDTTSAAATTAPSATTVTTAFTSNTVTLAPTTAGSSDISSDPTDGTSVNSESSQVTDSTLANSESGEQTVSTADSESTEDLKSYADGFHELYIHDECTDNNPADDVCAHARVHESPFTFGGDPGTLYEVKLRVRGLFEPTTVSGGATPYPAHPYFKVGGTVTAPDYSQWQIRITEPQATYFLNHYPNTGHTIYKQDFEATVQVRGGSAVVVRVEDGNDRQIDNGYVGLADRQQTIEGVTDGVVNGQVLRLDVLDVITAP